MTTSLLEHKRDYVVLIMIPPPSKDEEDWDTGEGDYLVKPYDHYKEIVVLQVPGDQNELSVKDQMAIKKDGITVFSPPNSNFFDVKQALKPSRTAHVGANEAEGDTSLSSAPVLVPLPPAYAPTALPFPQLPHWGYGYPPLPPNFPHVPGHPGHPLGAGFPYPYGHNLFTLPTQYANVHHPIGNAGLPPSPLPSPEEFCACYKIPDSDQEKLRWLEYWPGHARVTKLEEKHWLAEKFTLLGWEGFMDAHQWFLKDVWSGTWALLCGV
ncbi:hypothetical protein L208DRAFT_1383010 [Tricholoma matsutake]|nr:hypothetical protein L208DRAFT_1383010 [Tricholoma matsutake 945]